MHQAVCLQKEHVDLWPLYETGYRRELPTWQSLRAHALAPSTEKVCVSSDEHSTQIRARGPENRVVWLDIPHDPPPSLSTYHNFQILCVNLQMIGKLES